VIGSSIPTAATALTMLITQASSGARLMLSIGLLVASLSMVASSFFMLALTIRPAGRKFEPLARDEERIGVGVAALLSIVSLCLSTAMAAY
jgi:hypothetical protein